MLAGRFCQFFSTEIRRADVIADHRHYGGFVAFLFAWIVLLVISTGACAGVADFGAEQIESVLGLDPSPERRLAIACGLIVSITALGLTGVKTSAIFQNLCMLAKLLAIGVFVVAGLAFFGDVDAHVDIVSASLRYRF